MRKNLLTIGQLAALTNTHIKALRYYESIGILLPTDVDESNGYRYYAPSNILYVNIIKLCAENGLPLKQLNDFITQNRSAIELEKLIAYARALVEQKLVTAQSQLDFLTTIQAEIVTSGQIHAHGHVQKTLPASTFWCHAFDGTMFSFDYFQLLNEQLQLITDHHLQATNQVGLLLYADEQCVQRYLVVGITTENGNRSATTIVKQLLEQQRLTNLCQENVRKRSDSIASSDRLENWTYAHWTDGKIIALPKRTVSIKHVEAKEIAHVLTHTAMSPQLRLLLETYEQPYRLTTTHVEIQKMI